MATTSLQIIIEAIDKASGTLSAVGSSLKATGETLADIRKPALIATAALAGVATIGFKLAESAGQYESIRDAFGSMTEGMGIGVEDFEKKVADASAGTLDKLTILRGGTRALSLMGREAFSDFGEQFAQMAELSKKAARATGMDVTYMFDSLITGMSRESKMILDNLGITVDLTKAKEEYAASLGKEASELTIVEEKQAVLNHTLGKLEENYGNVAVSSGGMAGAMSKLKVTLADAKLEIGLALIPAFNELVRSITPLIKEYVPKLVEKIKELVGWFAELSPTGKKILLFFLALAPAIVALTTAGIVLIKGFTMMSSVLDGVVFMLTKLQAAIAFISAHPIILAIMAVIAVVYLLHKNWDKIREGLQIAWEATKEIFTTIGNFLKGVLIVWRETLRPIWQPIVEASERLFNFLSEWLKKISDFVKGAWGGIWNWVVEKIQWGYDRIKALIDRIKEIVAPITDLVRGVGEAVSGVGVKVGEGISGIGAGISSAVQKLIRIGAGTEAFGFQHGGIATSPMLARIAETEPEAVIPLSKLGMMRGDVNIYIQGGNYLDREAGEKFAEILGKMLRKELRYQQGY